MVEEPPPPPPQWACQYCAVRLTTKSQLVAHNAAVHPDKRPYACRHCGRSYKHDYDLKRHPCRKRPREASEDTAPASEDSGAPHPFLAWVAHQAHTKGPGEPSLAAGTAANALAFCRGAFVTALDWGDPDAFMDDVDGWETQERGRVQPKTVANSITHLTWYARWKCAINETSADVLEWLVDKAADAHRMAAVATTTQTCLAILDPAAMVEVRNAVVRALRAQQTAVLDPFITAHLNESATPTAAELIHFGLGLRCWIDLGMRFLGVPGRIQLTQGAVIATSRLADYTCKFVRRGARWTQLVNADKVQNYQAPLAIPLHPTLSAYVHYYLTRVRAAYPPSADDYVFLTEQGRRWRRASRDIKKYLQTTLGIDPARIDPTGRFVHGSRHIGLACYAVAVDFDPEKLRNFALLMRHSLSTALKSYNVWDAWWRANRAYASFASSVLGEAQPPLEPRVASVEPFEQLAPLPAALGRFAALDGHSVLADGPLMRSVGTQVCAEDIATPADRPPADRPPATPPCAGCAGPLDVLGPYGKRRQAARFGCYFMQCPKCDGMRPCARAMWLPLGASPPKESISNRPRNQDEILAHIARARAM